MIMTQGMTRLSVALPTRVTFHTKAWPRLFSWQQFDPLCLAFAYKTCTDFCWYRTVCIQSPYCLYTASICHLCLKQQSENPNTYSRVLPVVCVQMCTVLLLRSFQIYQTNAWAFPRLEDLLFVFILEMWRSKIGLSQGRSKHRQCIQIILQKGVAETLHLYIYIYIYQRLSKCLCVWIINILYILYILDVMLVYTCRDVCVWFELHCTYTFSPAKGCLELVDSGQAPWHLAYCCGEIVLLAKFGAMNLIESASWYLHDIPWEARMDPKKLLS